MMSDRPIVLTGFMASGKTRVARALAQRLRCAARDLDEEIIAACSRTPGDLIAEEGEAVFRKIESQVLRQALSARPRVIALGGGTWMSDENRKLIARYDGYTVWIDTPFEVCWKRICSAGKTRPLAPNQQEASDLYELRRPLYGLAELRLEASDEHSPDDLAARVTQAFVEANGRI